MRIGFLNIMPEAEKYEKYIFNLLERQSIPIEIILIKAKNHSYKSTNKKHLDKYYITFDQAIENQKLDGLIITGAPVETFPFEYITYWQELIEIFEYAKHNILSTMGLCWGGIAIGKYLGINSVQFNEKLFGVFPSVYLKKEHWMTDLTNREFDCPQSRYAGMNEEELLEAEKNGIIRLLVNAEEAGHYVFESIDERFIAHLGHPEYDTKRIIAEYERDIIKGLNHIPMYFDVKNPVDTWQNHGNDFFSKWIKKIIELHN
ncbi:MAG: homoserine O-succinyltransferase [Bacteroidetes bacterium]|nr:homoserine O-succinyltransferase [Bacteroidota bacterium]